MRPLRVRIVRTVGQTLLLAAQAAAFLLALSIIVFLLARLAPGDPLVAYYGEGADHLSTAQRTAALARLSLDQPLPAQYLSWLKGAVTGNWGISLQYKQPVTQVISEVWSNTLLLGGLSYVATFACALIVGSVCAATEGSWLDRALYRIGTLTSVVPSVFVALLGILLFSVELKWLPSSGAYTMSGSDVGDRLAHLVLPVGVMLLSHLWYYSYLIRNKLLEELRRDYVTLLKVKGVSRATILWRHCLRNIAPSLATIMAISVPHIIAGTYVVEKVFSYPGLGTLSFESARYHDYHMLAILTLITGAVVIVSNLLAQRLGEWLDPRMRGDVASVADADAGGATPPNVAGLEAATEAADIVEAGVLA